MHLRLYPYRMLACLVVMFYILKTKKDINHFISIPLLKVSMGHEDYCLCKNKQEIILTNMITCTPIARSHVHANTQVKWKRKPDTVPVLDVVPSWESMFITCCVLNMQAYHKCSLSFQNALAHLHQWNLTSGWGKGHIKIWRNSHIKFLPAICLSNKASVRF